MWWDPRCGECRRRRLEFKNNHLQFVRTLHWILFSGPPEQFIVKLNPTGAVLDGETFPNIVHPIQGWDRQHQGERNMLTAYYPNSGVAREVAATTPLLGLLQELLGPLNLGEALDEVGRWAGTLTGAPSTKATVKLILSKYLGELPMVQEALSRLGRAGLIKVEAGGTRYSGLGTLTELLSADPKYRTLELKPGVTRDLSPGDVSLTLSAEGGLKLQHEALTPAQAAEVNLPIGESELLHRFVLNAGLTVNGSAELEPISIGASAEAGASARWYFQRSATDSVINSLLDAAADLQQGVNPADLGNVFKVLDQPSRAGMQLDALRCIEVEYARGVAVKAAAELSHGITRDLAAVAGSKIVLNAAVSASFSYSFKRSGNYTARLTRQAEGILLSLRRSRERTSGKSFALDAGISLDGLDQAIKNLVDQVIPAPPAQWSAWLDKWSSPGNLLLAKIKPTLSHSLPNALQPLIPLLTGEQSTNETATAFADRLLGRVSTFLDRRRSLINEDLPALKERLLRYVDQRLGLQAQQAAPIRALLSEKLEQALTSLRSDLDAELTEALEGLRGQTTDVLQQALQPFAALAGGLNKLIANLNSAAIKALAPVRTGLAKYEALRKRLTTVAERAAKLKISLSFAYESSRTNRTTSELELLFQQDSPEARVVFRDFLVAAKPLDVVGLQEQIDKGTLTGVTIVGGSWLRSIQRSRKFTLTVNVFGCNFQEQRLLDSTLSIKTDATGVIQLSAVISQGKTSVTLEEQRQASFSADLDLLQHGPGGFALQFALDDNRLTVREAEQFIGSLVTGGLVGAAAIDRAVSILKSRPLQQRWRLDCTLLPSENFLTQLLDQDVKAVGKRAYANLYRELQGVRSSRLVFPYGRDPLEALVLELDTRDTNDMRVAAQKVLGGVAWGDIRDPDSNVYKARGFLTVLARSTQSVPQFIEALRGIEALRVPKGTQLAQNQWEKMQQQLDGFIEKAQRALMPIVNVTGMFPGLLTEALPRNTVALLRTLKDLAPDDLGAVLRLTPIFKDEDMDDGDSILIESN